MNHDHGNYRPGWYHRLSWFFKLKFGEAVYKIPIDAGFSCPNRDGTVGVGGCSYCYNPSFSPFSSEKPTSLREQILKGKKKNKKALYLAYFQAYTNTYAPVEELRKLYDEALADNEVVGLSIATRPDCISAEILNTLESYAKRCHLWVEYGLQSAHDVTLTCINRGHDAACFARAVEQTRDRGIFICAHIILGLPGESRDMVLQTIDFINRCGVDGVKFHHLQVIKNTALAEHYKNGGFTVYKKAEDYIPILCDCLEILDPQVVIHRLASQSASEDLLIAPQWPEGAGQIAAMVESELVKRGTHQGFLYQT